MVAKRHTGECGRAFPFVLCDFTHRTIWTLDQAGNVDGLIWARIKTEDTHSMKDQGQTKAVIGSTHRLQRFSS